MEIQQEDIKIPNISQLLATSKGQKDKNQIHACLFNLVVYVSGAKRIKIFQEKIKLFIERFPCRIFFIQVESESPKSMLQVKVSQEGVNKGGTSILCDELEITVSKDLLNRVPFLILPHIVPDLPIFLLWGEDPSQEKNIYPHLKTYASRLIIDAECSITLQQFCRNMLMKEQIYQMEVMDLNWALLSGWRKAFPQIFDSKERLEHLQFAKEIQIYYNQIDTDRSNQYETQAIYLVGWLASNFNWTFKKKDINDKKIRLHYIHSRGDLMVELTTKSNSTMNPGIIIGFDVQTYENNLYHLARTQNNNVRAEISTSEKCELPFTVGLPNVPGFLREIFYQATNENYLKMIQAIEPIDWSVPGDCR